VCAAHSLARRPEVGAGLQRPQPSSLVDLTSLRRERETCDENPEPDRCRWLAAILEHGPVVHCPFDSETRLF